MRMPAKNHTSSVATWAPPLIGLAGTVGGILLAFSRIGTEPEWETFLAGLAFSAGIGLVGAIVLSLAARRSP